MEKWRGKVALVTGASAGIGADLTVKLANAGLIVVGAARRVEAIEELKRNVNNENGGEIHARRCDLSNEAEILSLFQWIKEKIGHLNVLVSNAGVIKANLATAMSTEDLKNTFDVNLISACICIREGVKLIRENGSLGHIIVMNSVLGHRIPDVPVPLFNVYPASKFALTGLVQTIRQELNFTKANIKLTSISPGMVDTDLLRIYDSTLIEHLPKLNVADVTAAVLYALATADYVQVDEIILQAIFQHTQK